MSDSGQKIRKPKPTRWLNARDRIDNSLVLEMRIGNREAAWHELSVRYFQDIYRFCLSRLHDEVAAAEARAETMSRASMIAAGSLRKDGSYRYQLGGNFRALLYTIARGCCADEGRARARPCSDVDELDKRSKLPPVHPTALQEDLPRMRQVAKAKKALAGEDPRILDAVELFWERSNSHEEIAEVMDVDTRQVRTWLEKALRLMRKEMGVKGEVSTRKKRGRSCC